MSSYFEQIVTGIYEIILKEKKSSDERLKLVRKHGRLPLWNVVPTVLSETTAFDCYSNRGSLEKYTILLTIILCYAK